MVIIRVYAPIAVDAYAFDADDLAVFRAQTSAAIATEDTSLLAVCLRSRPLQGAPLWSRAALCAATARLVPRCALVENAVCVCSVGQSGANSLTDQPPEFLTARISHNFRYRL